MQTLIFNKSKRTSSSVWGGVSDCLVFKELTSDNNEDCRPESSQWVPGGIFLSAGTRSGALRAITLSKDNGKKDNNNNEQKNY